MTLERRWEQSPRMRKICGQSNAVSMVYSGVEAIQVGMTTYVPAGDSHDGWWERLTVAEGPIWFRRSSLAVVVGC